MYQEKNDAIRIALKHNNGFNTFPYVCNMEELCNAPIRFYMQIPSPEYPCELVPEEVEKTNKSAEQ